MVASRNRKRLGEDASGWGRTPPRGVFGKETRRKPLAFAADAGYALPLEFEMIADLGAGKDFGVGDGN